MIIGLCGAARSGKDTTALLIARQWSKQHGDPIGISYQRTKWVQVAGPVKAYCRDLFGWTEEHTDGALKDVPDTRYPRPCTRCGGTGTYQMFAGDDLRACLTCNGMKIVYLTPRHAMQFLGGEFANATYPHIYAERAARVAKEWHEEKEGNIALITDLRFVSNLRACKDAGGIVIMVERPGNVNGLSGEAAGHMSEVERRKPEFLDLVDITIINDGTLNDLETKVEALVRGYLG